MSTLIKNSLKNPAFPYLTKVLLGSLFITVSAQISIPFYPVPMTMQAAALMIIGLLCSPFLAVSIVGVYILEAAIGFPVLSNFTGGLEHLLGTRGGYIFGFLPLALMVSLIRQISESFLYRILGCLLGNIFLYGSGVLWLSHFIGLEKALQFGLYPFLLEIPLYIAFSILAADLLKKKAGHLFKI
jgi:biotin transport system substrate-specific component